MCRMAILGGDSWITMIGAYNGSEGDIKVSKRTESGSRGNSYISL